MLTFLLHIHRNLISSPHLDKKKMESDTVSASRTGNSLPVPNVQALAAASNDSGCVPERYMRPEVEADPAITDMDVEIPVIDLHRLLDPNYSEEELAKLGFACGDWGFFQLINHGISEQLIEKVKADIVEFFKLPLKEKEEYAQIPNSVEGYGQAFVMSEEQKLDWADMIYIITQPTASRNMRFWPTHPPTFRDTLEKYSLALKEVAACLLGLLENDMGLEPDVLLSKIADKSQGVRINYYPPCPKASKVIGLSPHCDPDCITILLQVNEVQGLQIRRDGKWLSISALPSALIVNIGDILEMMSNGKYKSVEHRAIINSEKARMSVAAFHSPGNGTTVGPLSELVRGGEHKYESMSYEDFMKTFFSEKLDGRSFLERSKLKN